MGEKLTNLKNMLLYPATKIKELSGLEMDYGSTVEAIGPRRI